MTVAKPFSERATLTIPEVAATLGISTWLAYDRAARGELPVPVIKIGRRLLVSRAALDRALAADGPAAAPAASQR